MNQCYVAADIGASGIKMIAASFQKERIVLQDTFAGSNAPSMMDGHQYADTKGILNVLGQGLSRFSSKGSCKSFGIDTYGNGYGVLDHNGLLLQKPHHYRDRRIDTIMEKVHENYTDRELYDRTGNYPIKTRALFHLYCDVLQHSDNIASGTTLLPLSNLFEYLMTGEAGAERSIASVLYLLNEDGSDWNYRVFRTFGIPEQLFLPLSEAGTPRGYVTKTFAEQAGCGRLPVITVLGHDTESALVAAPGLNEQKVFVSLGTSFIFGTQRDTQLICEEGFKNRFKNMRGAFGTYSLCKDFPGFWILERCMEQWRRESPDLDYEDVCQSARAAHENHSFINVSDDIFRVHGSNLVEEIENYCRRTNQEPVSGMGEISSCLFESYALQLRWCLIQLSQMTGIQYTELVAVNGGVKNSFLMQMIADATELSLVTGSSMASAYGNILMQLYADGEAGSLAELRTIAYSCGAVNRYESKSSFHWKESLQYMQQIGLFEEDGNGSAD